MQFDYSAIHALLSSVTSRAPASGVSSMENASEPFVALWASARAVRDEHYGRSVFMRGVVEFSNICRKDCLYCGLRIGNEHLHRFRLSYEEVLNAVEVAVSCGMGTVVLQAGEDPSWYGNMAGGAGSFKKETLSSFSVKEIGRLVETIKSRFDVAVTLSLGDHSEDTYRLWRDSGADRYLLKLETTDPVLHARLRPGQTVQDRLERVNLLQTLGFETGSGLITGLPDMSPEILARDILALSSLGLSMIAAGPFIPHAETPLGKKSSGNFIEALVVLAILRLLNPKANIPATSALDVLQPDGRIQGLAAGANIVMPSVTPSSVRKQYAIYPGKNQHMSPVSSIVEELKRSLREAGYIPSSGRGDSLVS